MNWTQRLARYYRTRIDPLFYKSRLLRRLGSYDLDPQSEMMVARLDGALGCACTQNMCHHLFVTYGGYFDQFFYSTDGNAPLYSKLTLHAIDLLRYKSFNEYRQDLGKRSSFFLRNAKQAEKLGYVLSEFDASEYEKDIAQITSSMKARSFGPMWINWLAQAKEKDSAFKRIPQNETHCPVHWDRFVGVFAHSPNTLQDDLKDARLVGYARLQRIGNCVAYEDLIGHRDFMNDGIMKLLHCHIVNWLLDSGDPDVQGLEYVVHGSIERGNDGIFFWKKKALFMPYLIELATTELPEDFVEEEYLRLNPDVKASGLAGASHYRLYGQKEVRHYQSENRRDLDENKQDAQGDQENDQEVDQAGVQVSHQSENQGDAIASTPPEVHDKNLAKTSEQSVAENMNLETAPMPNPVEQAKST
jgi:hypothetical protein